VPSQELHHFFGSPGHLRRTGFCLRVLLQSSNLVSVEYEVHLVRPFRGTVADGIPFSSQLYHASILDEDLTPDLSECLFEGRFHRKSRLGAYVILNQRTPSSSSTDQNDCILKGDSPIRAPVVRLGRAGMY
jgi:hypothetical protein